MGEFLEDWIRTRLGISVDFDKAGTQFFDGKLFFNILQSYNIVGPEVKQHFRRARTVEEALDNLNLLRFCFKLLGVLRDDVLLEKIARKNGSACIELLNELYLKLSNRHDLPIISKEKENQLLNNDTGRFRKFKVLEKKCFQPSKKRPEEKLLSRLKTSVRLFGDGDERTNRYHEMEEQRKQKLTKTSEMSKEEIKKGIESCNCKTTVDECLKKFDERVNSDLLDNTDFEKRQLYPPDEYVKMLKLRTLKQAANKQTEMKLKEIISKRIWCQQIKKKEEEFKCSFIEKFLKQSEYERQMAQRLGRIHMQYRVMANNRKRVHEEAQRIYNERMQIIEWRKDSQPDLELEKEKTRLLELHRKIFDQRIFQARQEKWSMVEATVQDIVNFAMKISEFESENKMQVPLREVRRWKTLFFKALPLLTTVKSSVSESYEIGAGEYDASELGESFDSYVDQSGISDEVLDYEDLNNYLILLGPWMKELWPEFEDVEEQLQVIGFIVHRLLALKYPLPEPPAPADVPQYPVRVIIDNLSDVKALKILKNLLEKPKIEILNVPLLINSFVGQYKKEMGIEEPVKGKKGKKKNQSKGVDKEKEKKPDKKSKKKSIEPLFKSVEVQFPSAPDLEQQKPTLSKRAELGKNAAEVLSSGTSLPDELIINIIIESIRNLEEREGWVIINFPLACNQVYLVELTLTGLKAPIKCDWKNQVAAKNEILDINSEVTASDDHLEFCEDFSIESSTISSEKLAELRTSRLVPRPNPPPPDYSFQTYFTKYIHAEHEPLTAGTIIEKNKTKQEITKIVESNDDREATDSLENMNDNVEKNHSDDEEEMDTPFSFYKTTDIYSPFPYKKFDLKTMKQLGRAILDETNEPGLDRKPSVELFGEAGKERKKHSSKASEKKVKKSAKAGGKKHKETPQVIVEEDENKGENLELDVAEKAPEAPIEPEVPCLIGDLCWEYSTLPISSEISEVLASFWESIEITYLDNLKTIFSFYRELDAIVVPYRNYIFNRIYKEMETPDNRQNVVTEFQNELNSLDDTLRGNGEIKKEWFCKIFELQLQLWELCDNKKNSSEKERQRVIAEKWVPRHICGLFNLYVSMIETELDRFIDSLKFLQEYHLACLGKTLNSQLYEKLSLPRFKISDFIVPVNESSSETALSEQYFGQEEYTASKELSLKSSTEKRIINVELPVDGISDHFSEMLTNTEFDRNVMNPFLEKMTELTQAVQAEIKECSYSEMIAIEKEQKSLLSKKKKTPKSKKKSATSPKSKKKHTQEDNKLKPNLNEQEIPQLDEVALQKEMTSKALSEWAYSVQNETDRVIFRLLLIKNRFGSDLAEFEDLMVDTFHRLHHEISTRFFEQTKHCDSLLKVFMAAVEGETNILPRLFLDLNSFYVESDEESFLTIPPPPVTPIEESEEDFTFTLNQLYKFAEKIMIVSPLGVTAESLIATVEDMALKGNENGYPYLPKIWSQMTTDEIRSVIKGVYGDMILIDWKDLMVFGLNFRFPTLQEIIDTTYTFLKLDPERTETICLEDFNKVKLWFEKDLCDDLNGDLRIALGKQFLFDLYCVDQNSMNYTAFLLNYCKDEDPVEGFAKALALATGFGYIMNEEQLYLLSLQNEKSEGQLVAEQIINILLFDVLNITEGIIITEVDDDGNPIVDDEEQYVQNDFGFEYSEKLLEVQKSVDDGNQEPTSNTPSQLKQGSLSLKFTPGSKNTLNSSGSKKKSEEAFQTLDEDAEDEITQIESLPVEIIWKSWLPRNVALNLLLTCLQSYALTEDEFYLQLRIEEALESLCQEKGVKDCIQAHDLAQSAFLKDLFSTCYKFKSCDLKQLIKTTLHSKRTSAVPDFF